MSEHDGLPLPWWIVRGRTLPLELPDTPGLELFLRPEPPDLLRFGNPSHAQNPRRRSHIDLPFPRDGQDLFEGLHHDSLQVLIDDPLVPEEGLKILHPFEVGNGHPSGVAQNVGGDEDPVLVKDLARARRGGAVGGLSHDFGPYSGGILERDLILERRRNENFALQLQQMLVVDRLTLGIPDDAAGPRFEIGQALERKAPRIMDTAARIADRDHLPTL